MMRFDGTPRRLALSIAALLSFAVLGACGELTGTKPSTSNFTDTLTLYAFNGTPANAASGLWLVGGAAIPIASSYAFDLAFDFGSSGELTMYTVKRVAGELVSVRSVGLQKVDTPFDDFLKAPKNGYTVDSLLTVNVGEVFAVRTADPTSCVITSLSTDIYAKLQILAVDPTARTIKTRFTVNPNCGFVSLVPSGVPKD